MQGKSFVFVLAMFIASSMNQVDGKVVKSEIWKEIGVPEPEDTVSFVIGLKQFVDHDDFVARNTPGHPNYHKGKFMTRDQARTLATQHMEPCRKTVQAFARKHGMKIESLTDYNEYFEVHSDVNTLENILGARFVKYSNGKIIVDRLDKSQKVNVFDKLPADVSNCISHFGRVVDFPIAKSSIQYTAHAGNKTVDITTEASATSCPRNVVCPQTWRSLYNIPDESGNTAPANVNQAVFEFASAETQSGQQVNSRYSQADLDTFQNTFGLEQRSFRTVNGGEGTCTTNSFNNCGEPNLDVQVMMATNTMNTAKAQNIYYNFLDSSSVLVSLALMDVSTLSVLSISYGGPEQADTTDCDEFKTLADQGVSVFIASGDQGANFGECTSDSGSCEYVVSADANCPYVTAVGGTNGFQQGDEVAATSENNCAITSGGGFSSVFTSKNYNLSWQKTATSTYVSDYLYKQVNGLYSAKSPHAGTGRGVPDISAAACNIYMVIGGSPITTVCGTSASTPAVAGMVSLMAMRQKVTGWGWINPVLYSNPSIFFDVTEGANYCGNSQQNACVDFNGEVFGYFASPGWDPVTGLGTLGTEGSFAALEKALLSARS